MKRLGHIFERVVGYETLAQSFYEVEKGKRWRSDVNAYSADLHSNLSRLFGRLMAGTFRFGNYRYFNIYDPKKRRIAVPPIEERIVHHAIISVVGKRLEDALVDRSYACRTGKGQWKAIGMARRLAAENAWCLKLDVKGYFDHIDHDVLMALLSRKIKDQRILVLLEDLIRSYSSDVENADDGNRGLPIGNLTSQYFANLYLDPLDRWLDGRGVSHIRYMDDLIVFGDHEELRSVMREAPIFLLRHLKLEFNDKGGLHRTSRGVDFLGCRVFDRGVRLSSRSRRRFLRKLSYYSDLEGACDEHWHEYWLQRRETALFAFVRKVDSFGFRRKAVEECGRRVEPRPSGRRLQQQQRVCTKLPLGMALLQQPVQRQQQQRLLRLSACCSPCSSVQEEANQNSRPSCSWPMSGQIEDRRIRALVGGSPRTLPMTHLRSPKTIHYQRKELS